MILSVDPGDTSGWSLWSDDMEFLDEGQADLDGIFDLLDECANRLTVIIYEDFIAYRNRAAKMVGSRFVASQVIGALKASARRHGTELVRQPANILPIAAMHSGRKQPSNHKISHAADAFNHAYYYGVKEGLLKTKLQLDEEARKLG